MSLLAFSALVGLAAAAMVIAALVSFSSRRPQENHAHSEIDTSIHLLFRNNRLVDADNGLWPFFGPPENDQLTWHSVYDALHPIIPGFPKTCPTTSGPLSPVSGPKIVATVLDDTVRVSIQPTVEMHTEWLSLHRKAMELAVLEPALELSPNPIWCASGDGKFQWGNEAFNTLAKDRGDPDAFTRKIAGHVGETSSKAAKRIALKMRETRKERWFEVSAQATETGILYFATDVDAVVRAEEAQRNFVQTLSKTFANLTTGLAIFDRNRRLALFNPALIDLSGLSAEFLSGRPNLFDFFDQLRDQQIMPEPKCYDNWRECMGRLIAAASDDRFRETWNLPSGQTFDVTGKPYPDGAIAFLFNDITAEVSLTRGFRTELETMQSSLDVMEDAIAIFNPQGVLTVCNEAYKAMWNVDPDTSIIDATILDATQEWKTAFHPAPLWPEIRDYVTNTQERASWDSDLRSKDGREVTCRIDPICYGATMIRFCHVGPREDTQDKQEPLQIVSA